MNYRRLGKTNLYVSEVGLGGIPIQRSNQDEVNAIINLLVEKKVNFIDTANAYTTSEEMLGIALEEKREKFIIATKSMKRDYEGMKNDILSSLKKLKTNFIDIYQCHNIRSIEEYRKIMEDNGAYKALVEAKKEGLIRHIGISSHSADFLLSIIDKEEFETIQFPLNFLELQGEALFAKAKKLDIGNIVMKPFAGGVIDKGEISLKYILNNQDITVAIPGMANVFEVEKNIEAVTNISLTKVEQEYIEEVRNKLSSDFCHRCGYCLPCVKNIDIPTIFTLELYYNNYDLKDWAVNRYKNISTNASACIACRKCEEKCPYQLPISKRMSKINDLFTKALY